MLFGFNSIYKVKIAGFIGDIHAEDAYVQLILTFFKERGIKDIFCMGDFCDGYGDVVRAISLIKKSGAVSVQGNHDLWYISGIMRNLANSTPSGELSLETTEYIKSLPKIVNFKSAAGEVLICHGILSNEMAKINPGDFGYSIEANMELQEFIKGSYPPIMINGHSHRRMVKKIEGKTIINVGTIFRDHNPCFCIIDFIKKEVYFYDLTDDRVCSEPELYIF
ncbi:MAG: metallophosphatase family protein [Clostridia bacterium]|nr:metallophosphatase family protein [Clostridia bacterium]